MFSIATETLKAFAGWNIKLQNLFGSTTRCHEGAKTPGNTKIFGTILPLCASLWLGASVAIKLKVVIPVPGSRYSGNLRGCRGPAG
ncbi:hypothetical protein GGU45_002009 [Niabella hirudinis]